MNINDLRAFIAVAETGSVSRAALTLHLTQPALTRRVQNLEARLGASLLDRTTKPPTLTSTGYRVLDTGRRVLRSLTELEESCRTDGEVTGPLRLGIAHGLAEDVLAAPLAGLQHAFPKLRLLVKTGWTRGLVEELEHAALDGLIGLLPTDHPGPSSPVETLGQEAVAVVAPRQWSAPEPIDPTVLHDVSWVLNPMGCSYRTALETAFDRHGVPVRVTMEVLGRELQLSLVARGAGLGLCPVRGLRASPLAADVRVLKLPDLNIRADVALIRGPGTSDLSRVFATLAAAVGQTLRDSATEELLSPVPASDGAQDL